MVVGVAKPLLRCSVLNLECGICFSQDACAHAAVVTRCAHACIVQSVMCACTPLLGLLCGVRTTSHHDLQQGVGIPAGSQVPPHYAPKTYRFEAYSLQTFPFWVLGGGIRWSAAGLPSQGAHEAAYHHRLS